MSVLDIRHVNRGLTGPAKIKRHGHGPHLAFKTAGRARGEPEQAQGGVRGSFKSRLLQYKSLFLKSEHCEPYISNGSFQELASLS